VRARTITALSKEINSEQIEDVLAIFSAMGINVVEPQARD
jgi:hypothetical protein